MASVVFIILLLCGIALLPVKYPFLTRIKYPSNVNRGGYLFDYQETTSAKGLAMLFILIGHISGTFSTVVFTPLPAAGVSMFLILSGYGLSESFRKNGLDKFWSKKITRVLIPYAIVITTIMIAKSDMSFSKWILEITGLKTSYWYIAYQIKWYIAFFLVMFLIPRKSILAFSIIAFIMFFTLGSLEIEQSPSFLIGSVASVYKKQLSCISYKSLWLVFAIALLTGTFLLGIKQLPVIRAIIGTLSYSLIQMGQNICLAISFITLFSLIPKLANNSLLIYCGVVSYELYLLHFPFYGMTDGNILYAIILIIASMVASGLFFYVNQWICRHLNSHPSMSKL